MIKKVDKILWQDGMFIHPQHFQQQDIYYGFLINNYQLSQPYYNWGIIELEIDEAFLKLNKIVLKRAKGILPDGSFFTIPARDNVPSPLTLEKDYINRLVYLGVSISEKYGLALLNGERNMSNKYQAEEQDITDLNLENGQSQKITIGKLNIQLLMDDEYVDSAIRLPLFKIIKADNGLVFDNNYIPPCLNISNNSNLISLIYRVIGILIHHLKLFSAVNIINSNNAYSEVKHYMILQIINKHKNNLELLVLHPATPLYVYEQLLTLDAELQTFTKDFPDVKQKFAYKHDDIAISFNNIITHIESIFVEFKNAIPIELEFTVKDNNVYTLNLKNIPFDNSNMKMILGIRLVDMIDHPDDILQRFIKIASINEINKVIDLRVSGLVIQPFEVPKNFNNYYHHTIYFEIIKQGNFWQQVVEQQNIAIYLNHNVIKLKNVKLWLITI